MQHTAPEHAAASPSGARTPHAGRPIRKALLVIAALLVAATLGVWWIPNQVRRAQGEFNASEYPEIRGLFSMGVSHVPATIPPNATEVRIFCPGVAWALLPCPDSYLELRMMVPPAEAVAIAASAKARQDALKDQTNIGFGSMTRTLRTATPGHDPTAFESYTVGYSKSSGKLCYSGITVDVKTGEVIYWFFTL